MEFTFVTFGPKKHFPACQTFPWFLQLSYTFEKYRTMVCLCKCCYQLNAFGCFDRVSIRMKELDD